MSKPDLAKDQGIRRLFTHGGKLLTALLAIPFVAFADITGRVVRNGPRKLDSTISAFPGYAASLAAGS